MIFTGLWLSLRRRLICLEYILILLHFSKIRDIIHPCKSLTHLNDFFMSLSKSILIAPLDYQIKWLVITLWWVINAIFLILYKLVNQESLISHSRWENTPLEKNQETVLNPKWYFEIYQPFISGRYILLRKVDRIDKASLNRPDDCVIHVHL